MFFLGYPPEVTLYITIVIEVIALIFRFFFLKRLMNFPIFRFIKEVLLKNFAIVIISTIFPLIIRNTMCESIQRLVLTVLISIIWNGLVIYFIGLSKVQKSFIHSKLNLIAKRTK